MQSLDKHDIQGLVARGYGGLHAARFLLLEIIDPARAGGYLQDLVGRVTRADTSPADVAIHVAFTWSGLRELGLQANDLASFAREFNEGMDEPTRALSLGDQGPNDPAGWTWGRDKPHVLLLIYATEDGLEDRVRAERDAFAGGLRVMHEKSTVRLRDQKEHFGWRDGVSTPIMEGFDAKDPAWTFPFRAGEFVLGYPNEYEAYSESPTVELAHDLQHHLPVTRDGAAKDLGRNGTYLVYREMTQDVPELWRYLHDHAHGDDRVASAIALGAKMIGRWPSGAPLIEAKDRDDPTLLDDNGFTYYGVDPAGMRCPVGAHIRRANPRDQLPTDHDREDSVEMVRKHQMLRRGRSFGPPLADSMDPHDFLTAPRDPDAPRGLHFICLVGHIGRQFEFVQRAWINSPNFAALTRDADPIIGVHRAAPDRNASDEFTCPATPVRRKYKGLTQFTQLVGGAYFFLPGLRALQFIARLPAQP